MTDDSSDWVRCDDPPLMLDGTELSGEDCAELRSEFNANLCDAVCKAARKLNRVPSDEELHMISDACVRHANEHIVPRLRQRAVGLH